MRYMSAFLLVIVALCAIPAVQAAVVVSPPAKASPVETLAARELQRYIYLRTGNLSNISADSSTERIIVGGKGSLLPVDNPAVRKASETLGADQYLIKTTSDRGRRTWWIIGGDDAGVLYGTYRFIEKLGVRFYLHGDVIPDARLARLPDVNETGKPIFSVRGIQPFHDFSEGPDWWTTDDYLAYISQLPKMRMNFIGFHCYFGEVGVWIGLGSDVDERGRVSSSYAARWANTLGGWGYGPMNTSEFCSGAALLFTNDVYGSEVMNGRFPMAEDPQERNDVFNRVGDLFGAAFSHARSLGVKTCVGTETPLIIPGEVREKLEQQGKKHTDPDAVREVYEGMFKRISLAYPVDYYWLWTPETWTWSGNTEETLEATYSDIRTALAALENVGNPFTLATSGWVLGPVQDRAALDAVLPKDSPMSCISQMVGHAALEPAFADISGRPKWAIPWLENDPAMTAPQPWVGRMRYDAADALRLGCDGLLGIHWRTKVIAQNIAALADAAWDQSWARFDQQPGSRLRLDGPLNGKIVTYHDPIEDTDEDPVYQSVRYNVDGYQLIVPNGTYTVTLKFSEVAHEAVGLRTFGVKLQGKQVEDSLDIYARVGKNRAFDITCSDVAVKGHQVRIDFVRKTELPCIAGIVIEGLTDSGRRYIRKINCGGRRYFSYAADTTLPVDATDRRAMPVEDFYVDFARASFGEEVAAAAGKIMAKIDGRGMPEPVVWAEGPGGVAPNRQPWDKVKEGYWFVDEFAALRQQVTEPGNRARFDYWLNTYRFVEALGHAGCVRGQLDSKVEAIEAATDPARKKQLAEEALVLREQLSRAWERAISLQLAAVDTPGEMGTIDNLERHSREQLQFLGKHDELLATTLDAPLPDSLALRSTYHGPSRIIVPTVRTQVKAGEKMSLRVIVLDNDRPTNLVLRWRPLGQGEYHSVDFRHTGRAVYETTLPAAESAYEYYIAAQVPSGKLIWPATAPKLNQTVVVW